MTTPSRHILYRTTTNLIHPAVLGTLIVNCIQLVLSGGIITKGLFPILASALLVWYFILVFSCTD
ncbi:MAG TPA: hypothetical protein PLF11_16945 [Bacillota bacterium]|jgi:hypothetical protein|nr:hypothetical protein [Bacillota bacterium]